MKKTEALLAGYKCIKLENDCLCVWVARTVGPRVLGLAPQGRDNLFALLPPDEGIPLADGKRFTFYGGHRLWHAPEEPPRTYLPDDAPVLITEMEGGLTITQSIEPETGIQKSLTLVLDEQWPLIAVDHTLRNLGEEPVELAAWAITQVRPGGVAILPQPTGPADRYGVLPNRHIVLWPYTSIHSPYIEWGDRYIFVRAAMESGALKLGFPNPVGWLAYALGDVLFVKQAPYRPDMPYFDRGASSECYCDPRFLELETLGPRTRLAPGDAVTHRETWSVFTGIPFRPDEAVFQELAERLGLLTETERSV